MPHVLTRPHLSTTLFAGLALAAIAGWQMPGLWRSTASTAQTAYVNGTAIGQAQRDDLGFLQGVSLEPAGAAHREPWLWFDVQSGFATAQHDLTWSVARDGVEIAFGRVPSLIPFGGTDVAVPITPLPGVHTYRVTIDPQRANSEANRANNVADFTVCVPVAN